MRIRSALTHKAAAALALAILALPLTTSRGQAQAVARTTEPAASEQKPRQQLEMFVLKNLAAQDAAATIETLLHDEVELTLAPEVRTNTILARGSEEVLQIVSDLLDRMDNAATASASDTENVLAVYSLRYMMAKDAYAVVTSLLNEIPNARASIDEQLNRIIVSSPEPGHALVAEALSKIDRAVGGANRPVTAVLKRSNLPLSSTGEIKLAQGAAKQHQVQFEFIHELGVAIVRGSAESVEDFVNDMQQIKETVDAQLAQEADAANRRTHALRIIWLVASDQAPETPDDQLDAIRRRAEQFGIHNLVQVGQLIASSRAEKDKPAAFTVSGTSTLEGKRFELRAEGGLAAIDDDESAFSIRLSLVATPLQQIGRGGMGGAMRDTRDTLAEVDMQMGAGKPVILAAVPIEGKQSVFVVEIVTIPR